MKQWIWMMIVLFLLAACSREPRVNNADVVTVQSESITNHLYYSGTITPEKTVVLASPADGVVINMFFQYGDLVKKGQPLFEISSTKFLSDYKSALLDYIKAKNDFMQNKTQLNETEFLHKNLLISDDDYQSKKSAYYASQLAYVQAKDALSVYLKQMHSDDVNLYQLSISDIDKINQAIHFNENTDNITLTAPATGLVLSPMKDDSDPTKKINKGDAVKQGDTLVMMGDMSSVVASFKVNELTIGQIKVGQAVTMTGVAFPNMELHGSVIRVDKQGDTSNGGMPSFLVEVASPLDESSQHNIYPGMSTNIDVTIAEPSHIMIPIRALLESDTQSYVRIIDAKTHQLKKIAVVTGQTTPTEVEIQQGLHAGDRLVVPH